MSYRQVEGLRWAQCAKEGPFGRPKRPRGSRAGAKAKGLRYERELARALPQAMHGQWINFSDKNGPGWAQPDFLVEFPFADCILILETKLSWVPEAYGQIEYLYKPLVERIWDKPAYGIVVTRNLTPECRSVSKFSFLDEAAQAAINEQRTVLWHWLGTGPLFSPAVRNLLRSRADAAYATTT